MSFNCAKNLSAWGFALLSLGVLFSESLHYDPHHNGSGETYPVILGKFRTSDSTEIIIHS